MMKNNFRLVDRLKSMLFVSVLLLGFGFMNAQTKTITGTVTGEGYPLPAVSVLIKGSSSGTVSDFDGIFILEAEEGDVLVFDYVGFKSQEVVVGKENTINVSMKEDVSVLEEVVVVGYQKQKKIEVTGAISSVKGDELTKQAVGDPAEALQGKLAGVNIQASSGSPGARANVQIRGANSLNGSDSDFNNPNAALQNPLADGLSPLWVVDGLPVTGDPNLSPSEIESIEVLKDGASASIYGIRAAAGVILVTTKRGVKGKLKVDFNTYSSVNRLTRRVSVLNSSQALANDRNIIENTGGQVQTEGILTRNPNAFNFDTDWQDEILNQYAYSNNANLRFSGGVDFLNYSLNIDYLNQEGNIVNSNFERTNIKLNTGFNNGGKFNAFTSFSISNSNARVEPWRILYDALTAPSYIQGPGDLANANTISLDENSANTIAANNVIDKLRQENRRETLSGSLYGTFNYNWFEGFNTKLNLSFSRFDLKDRFFDPAFFFLGLDGGVNEGQIAQTIATLQERRGLGKTSLVEFFTEYEKDFSGHKLSGLVGVTSENRSWAQSGVSVRDFDTAGFPNINAAKDKSAVQASGNLTVNKLRSLVGNMGYGFKEKYLLRANVRRDQTSNFTAENRAETFGGISLGWVPSKESFIENSDFLSFIESLKFRASIGWVGNQNVEAFIANPGISSGTNIILGTRNVEVVGISRTQIGNLDLTWETSVSENLGVDLLLFGGAFNFTGELYRVEKDNLLFLANTALSSGFNPTFPSPTATVFSNVGALVNEGVELTAGYRDIKGKFQWNLSGTFTSNSNEITALAGTTSQINGGQPAPGTNQLQNFPVNFGREGFPVGSFFLLDSDGLIRNQTELDEYQLLGGAIPSNAKIGDLRFKDVDGDGSINVQNDRTFKGSSLPDFEIGLNYGMNYQNFDFSMQWFASFGAKIYNGPKALAYNAQNHTDLLFAYRADNQASEIPINRQRARPTNFLSITDQFIEDGDYIRLRNIQIGYNFPKETLKKANLSKLRIYLAASNVLTITDYTGFDPEVGGNGLFSRGIDRGYTPVTGSGRLGLELSF
ncbi:SusC/RagA family TonB-linked outer membrane protein [Aquimarina agarivorans]|uniref:SusC/RagA family TonB-linked outer membrane protein n=1 Tax=Aquimarina agarivorans TaxID=980584 RepID=UPI0002DE8736|nr:SusC/RagA family TonB-linked outer membrane protein [Aquimarina agarivorans]